MPTLKDSNSSSSTANEAAIIEKAASLVAVARTNIINKNIQRASTSNVEQSSSESDEVVEQSPGDKRSHTPKTLDDNNNTSKRQKQDDSVDLSTNEDISNDTTKKSSTIAKKGGDNDTISSKINLSKEQSISDEKEAARRTNTTAGDVLTVEDDDDDDDDEEPWLICPPCASRSSEQWTNFYVFDRHKHPDKHEYAACLHCWKNKNYVRGTVKCTGGSTSGLKRHMQSHHRAELEAMQKKKSSQAQTSNLRDHFAKKKKEPGLGVSDLRSMFKVAAVTLSIEEAVPFSLFSAPSFRNLFKPLHKKWDEIVNVDRRCIREETMKMGRYAEEATIKELKGRPISRTTDHWTGPNDESYSTLTAHFIDDDWNIRSAILDFKVFQGRTTGELIYADVESVLEKFKDETTVVVDTIGITDTTGNMGRLGVFCRENGRRHAYCIDHNMNRCAQLAFDRKLCWVCESDLHMHSLTLFMMSLPLFTMFIHSEEYSTCGSCNEEGSCCEYLLRQFYAGNGEIVNLPTYE